MSHSLLTAIVGATLVDGNGDAPIENGTILIEGTRISTVGPHSVPIPPQAVQIQADGKFITPGLMYPQATFVPLAWPPEVTSSENRLDAVALEAAQLALKGGVTTVFDWTGPRDALLKAREAIGSARAIGSRIKVCGYWIGGGGPFSSEILDHGQEEVGSGVLESRQAAAVAATDAETKARINAMWELNVGAALVRMPLEKARLEVRKYVRSGVDFVTYLINSHRLGAYDLTVFSSRVQRMIVEEAHEAGLPVQAFFASTEEGFRSALEAGADIISHAPWGFTPLSPETLDAAARSDSFVHIIATTSEEIEWYRRQPPGALYTGSLEMFETSEIDHRALIRAGAKVISAGWNTLVGAQMQEVCSASPSTPVMAQMGAGHVAGLQALQDKGMTPMQALMAATRSVAQAFKVDADLGTLERGKLADLVVWDENPLVSSRNYAAIHLVMKEGVVVDRNSLPRQRVWTRNAA